MRKPIQSLRLILAASLAPAAFSVVPLPAVGQEAPSARPAPILLTPATPQDRLETRPPDCLTCNPSPPRPSLIMQPSWDRLPDPVYPDRALRRGVAEGAVVLICGVAPDGMLHTCQIESEDPLGAGFGMEAIAGAHRARLSARSMSRDNPQARVRFVTRFRAPEPEPEQVPNPGS